MRLRTVAARVLCAGVLAGPAVLLAADPQPLPPGVAIRGEGLTGLRVSSEAFQSMTRRSLHLEEHGVAADFSGVEIGDLLRQAGAPLGEHLRGASLASYVVVEGADHYRAVYALAELDSALTTKTVLLVDQRDGKPLSDHEGPFRVVASDEKRPARWVRQVVSITLFAAKP